MITVVHGNDNATSRKFFTDQRKADDLSFDAEEIDTAGLEQSLGGLGLFSASKRVFIDNLFSRKSIKNFEEIARLLNKFAKDFEIFVWSDKELGVKALSVFENKDVRGFKIPQNIFSFLDSVRPNSTRNVASFHDALKHSDPEIIFFMLIRQFRLLIGIIDSDSSNAEEVKRLAPWQKSKLIRQAEMFGKDNLIRIYKKIYKIDKSQKTGKTNLTLTQNIDILLLEI